MKLRIFGIFALALMVFSMLSPVIAQGGQSAPVDVIIGVKRGNSILPVLLEPPIKPIRRPLGAVQAPKLN